MAVSPAYRDKTRAAYMRFFEIAEKRRRWNMWDDVDWDSLDPTLTDDADAIRLETFCGVELYVPDYTEAGFRVTRETFGEAWFQANWGYEESKHALVFREYLLQAGLRTTDEYNAYEKRIFDLKWNMPFETVREMACYGALQEQATLLIYKAQQRRAEQRGNHVLAKIYALVSRDEAAHMGWYRRLIKFHMEEDREGTLLDLGHVIRHFEMPGVALIPEYEHRLGTEGVGITPAEFLQYGVFPTLRFFGTSRRELYRLAKAQEVERNRVPVKSFVPADVAE